MPTSPAAKTANSKAQREADRAATEIEKIAAERDFHIANARVADVLREQEEIALRVRQRAETEHLSRNEFHKVYVFDDDVDDQSVKDCVKQLTTWDRNDPGCDVEIQLNTGGGSIFAGFALIDFIREMRRRQHKVTIVVYGHAASMGAVILQSANHRIVGENSFLLVHEGSMFTGGDFRQLEDDMKLYGKLQERILAILADRATLTVSQIKTKWKRTDWWLTARESVDAGFADELR